MRAKYASTSPRLVTSSASNAERNWATVFSTTGYEPPFVVTPRSSSTIATNPEFASLPVTCAQ
jgi:hypothetical protein